jgi:hypothetical protein
MTQDKLERLLYEAFLNAAKQMGPRIKGMSCFLKNWRHPQEISTVRDVREAA